MSRVFLTSDLHLGHRAITKYRTEFSTMEEHNQAIIDGWNSVVTKRDLVYVLGDAVFDSKYLYIINQLKGRKILIRGNHDMLRTHEYLSVFDEIHGIIKYKGVWLSHAPIHPSELRGCFNIHGHVHWSTIHDARYFNACIENIGYKPIQFMAVKSLLSNDLGGIGNV